MEKKRSTAFFSNRLERLADLLYAQLYSAKTAFARRLVVVPEGRIKSFLYEYFALNTPAQVAFGLEVMTLSEAVIELTKTYKKSAPFYFPSPLDLSIYLEEKITGLHLARPPQESLTPLWKYLQEKEEKISPQSRRKIISLSEQLASFFTLLGMQPGVLIDQWLAKGGWQQELWKTVFVEGSIWSYPQKILDHVKPSRENIHLFGFSYIPKVYFDFFQKVSTSTYLLSPSEYFWEDLYSDRERVYLQKILEGRKVRLKVREQLDFYLRESNPLLGNWGRRGKEFLNRLGEKEPYMEEDYVAPEGTGLLAKVQGDFLFLGESEPSLVESDDSLQLHACTSKLREVEVLYENLLLLLKNSEKEQAPLAPSDILVFSPTLRDYIPYIHQVFGEADLEYRILDGEEKNRDDSLAAIEHLLSLSEKRLERSAVLELFSFTPFQNKLGWKKEDVYLLTKWVDKVLIQWGYDKENRKEILSKSLGAVEEAPTVGSWQHGLERLLSGLVFGNLDLLSDGEVPFAWPEHCIEWSDSELLGQMISAVFSLAKDIKYLDSLSAPFAEWVELFEKLCQKYFQAEEDNPFSLACHRLKDLIGESSTPFSLESFRRVIRQLSRKRKTAFQGSLLEAVTFAEYELGHVYPAQAIYLLGMEEESFPRREPSYLMCDFSHLKNKAYLPTQAEEDRYLFLETLLSARKHLFLSYCRLSSKDHKPQNAAAVIEELFTFVENRYEIKEKKGLVFIHPALSFHERYFMERDLPAPLSSSMQKSARSYYSTEKEPLPPFFPEFYGEEKEKKGSSGDPEVLSIKELTRFAKHPIKFFLQDVLGIYLPSLFQKEEAEFLLPGYEKSQLRSNMLKNLLTQALSISRAKGILPIGIFEELSTRKIEEENQVLQASLKSWNLSPQEIFSVQLLESCSAPSYHSSSGKWYIPAVHLHSPSGKAFIIEGTLPDVSPKGLLFYGENKIKDLVSLWPQFLLYSLIAPQIEADGRRLYLTKKPEALWFDLENPSELLGIYLEYFVSCKTQASLLMPAWSEWILENQAEEFAKKMKAKDFVEVSPFPDDYLRWVFLRDPEPSLEGFFAQQKRIQAQLFAPLFTRSKDS